MTKILSKLINMVIVETGAPWGDVGFFCLWIIILECNIYVFIFFENICAVKIK